MAVEGNGFTVKEIVVRLEAKVDKLLDDHEKRLRVLEEDKSRWQGGKSAALGGVALLASFGALVVTLIH